MFPSSFSYLKGAWLCESDEAFYSDGKNSTRPWTQFGIDFTTSALVPYYRKPFAKHFEVKLEPEGPWPLSNYGRNDFE